MFALAEFEKFIIAPNAAAVEAVYVKIELFIVDELVALDVLAISIKAFTLAEFEFWIRDEPNKFTLDEPFAFINDSIVFASVGLFVICEPIILIAPFVSNIATVLLFAYITELFFIVQSAKNPPPVELISIALKPAPGAITTFDNTKLFVYTVAFDCDILPTI